MWACDAGPRTVGRPAIGCLGPVGVPAPPPAFLIFGGGAAAAASGDGFLYAVRRARPHDTHRSRPPPPDPARRRTLPPTDRRRSYRRAPPSCATVVRHRRHDHLFCGSSTRTAAHCRPPPPTAAHRCPLPPTDRRRAHRRAPTSCATVVRHCRAPPSCATVVTPIFVAVAFARPTCGRQAMDEANEDELELAAVLGARACFGARRARLAVCAGHVRKRAGGSRRGRRPNRQRDFDLGAFAILSDYFGVD